MFGRAKTPRDPFPYPRSLQSCPASTNMAMGRYVFVVDLDAVIHVAPDGLHMHPQVFGHAQQALYAGEIAIDQPGNVNEVTNLSGTFQFRSKRSLCCVAEGLRRFGFSVGDVVWYPPDGRSNPVVLTCA